MRIRLRLLADSLLGRIGYRLKTGVLQPPPPAPPPDPRSDFAKWRDECRKNFSRQDWLRITVGMSHLPFGDPECQHVVGSPMYWATGYFILWRVEKHLLMNSQGDGLPMVLHFMQRLYAECKAEFPYLITEAVERAGDMFEDWRKRKMRFPA